jgi:hypothetical protein
VVDAESRLWTVMVVGRIDDDRGIRPVRGQSCLGTPLDLVRVAFRETRKWLITTGLRPLG